MAATISDLANGLGSATGTALATGATVTAAVGDWLVVVVAASNDGTLGAASITTVVDSGGVNTYNQRALINYDPGAAGAGATLGIYTCAVTSALSNATITVNQSGNTDDKAVQVYKVVPGAGETISLIAVDTSGLTGNATEYTANTVSVTSGDIIFGAAAIETDDAVTGDTDTTNGNWSSVLTRLDDNGADAATMSCVSQYKTATGTGNQTWSCTTVTGRDSARTYIIISSAVASRIADLGQTLGSATSSSGAANAIAGAVSQTLGAVTIASAAKNAIAASLAQTLGSTTLEAAAGQVPRVGDFAQTLGDITLSATAADAVAASLSQTLGNTTLSASGAVAVSAAVSQTLGNLSLASGGTTAIAASVSQTLGETSLSATGALTITADAGNMLGAATLNSTAADAITASLAQTLGAVTLSAGAGADVAASLAQTLTDASLSGAGTAAISAALTATLGAVELAAAAASPGAGTAADFSQTLGDATLAATSSNAIAAQSSVTLGGAALNSASALSIVVDFAQVLGSVALAAEANTGAERIAGLAVTLDDVDLAAGATKPTVTTSQQAGSRGRTKGRKKPRFSGFVELPPQPEKLPELRAELNITLGDMQLLSELTMSEAPKARQRRQTLAMLMLS